MGRPIKLLLIEDNPGDVRLLEEMLAEAGEDSFVLESADRLSTGLERLAIGDIDVVLVDLSLPDSRGAATFAQVQAQAPHVPIIILSGLDDEELALQAVRSGAQDYLVKGQVTSVLLTRAVQYAIERKRADLRQMYYLQTEHVLRRISGRLMNPQNLDQAINETLRDIGDVVHADQAYLVRINEDAVMTATHFWSAGDAEPPVARRRGVDATLLPWVMERLHANEVLAISDVSQLPPPERAIHEERGLLSTLTVPIFVHGVLHGFVGLATTSQRREWQNEEIGFLRNAAEIIGRALERAQTEQFLQQRNLELATLNAVSQALSASLQLKDLLDEALSRTAYALGFPGGVIYLRDERTGAMRLYSYTGLVVPVERLNSRPDCALCELICRQGKPLALEDLRDATPVDVSELLGIGLRSYMGAPIIHKERVLGALCLFDAAPHIISRGDTALLTAIGQQIGVAVENARLFESVVRERQIAQTLLDTAEALSTTLRIDKLLERVLDTLQRVLPYDAASISMLRSANVPAAPDSRSVSAWMIASRGLETIPRGFAWEQFPLLQRVVRKRALVIVPDVQQETAWLPIEGMGSVRSWLSAPLISKDEVIGVLMVASNHPGAYNDENARLALAFAHQVALAIDNSRLYEQTRAQLREAVMLHNVTAALSSTLDAGQILPYMARSLCEILNSSGVEIYGLDDKSNVITSLAQYVANGGEPPPSNRSYALAELPATAEALARRTPLQIRANDPALEPRERARLEAYSAQTILLLPMIARDRVLGFAQVWESEAPRHFTDGEIALGQTLTHQAAIAAENARLFEETQRRLRELQLLHDVGLAAASGVRLEETLDAAADALASALPGTHIALLLLDPESGTLRMEAGNLPAGARNLHLRPGQGIAGWVVQHGEPLLVPDVRRDPRYIEVIPDVRSELCVPLAAGPLVIGALDVGSPQLNGFTEHDQRLLSTLASNLAILIERARLFEAVEAARLESQRRAEALEEANVRLKELDRLKSRFLASMSHELRTPLNSIIGFSEVLLDGLMGEMPPEQKECVRDILSSGEHLLALINDVLDFSKIEAGRMTLEPTAFDVTEWLKEIQTTITPLVGKKSQTLHVELADGLPPLVADRFRLKQVLLNLLSNATKFTPEGGHITLSCRLADPTTMLFSVADTGIGIRPQDQEHIFEEFRRAEDAAVREISGTGLGLAISKRLIEMHGGRIWVESEYGHGATFSFLLPLGGPQSAKTETTGGSAMSNKTVLIIEDDRQFSNLLALYLSQEGYTPIQHYSGAGAFERARELKPDFITLDLRLPERDGWEVLRALKADPQTKDIPVLVISVSEDGELALNLGALDFMPKPVRRSDLQALLSRLATPQPPEHAVKVLVVDDDQEMIRLLKEILATDHYTVLLARDGEEGLNIARSEHPDAIILDLMMPEMSGFEMLERLRADPETADIPVTVLTAIDVTGEKRRFIEAHIQGFMPKTMLTPQALLAEIRRLEAINLAAKSLSEKTVA